MAELSQMLTNTNNRVTALENADLDEAATIARISKLYSNVKIQVTITANVHHYNMCSPNTMLMNNRML